MLLVGFYAVINKKGQINILNTKAPKLLDISLSDYKNKSFRYLSNNIELQNKMRYNCRKWRDWYDN